MCENLSSKLTYSGAFSKAKSHWLTLSKKNCKQIILREVTMIGYSRYELGPYCMDPEEDEFEKEYNLMEVDIYDAADYE